jgi:hypothetical protein
MLIKLRKGKEQKGNKMDEKGTVPAESTNYDRVSHGGS